MSLLKFGEVIRYSEDEYVYLGATDEIIFLAKILNHDHSRKVQEQYEVLDAAGTVSAQLKLRSVLYCFVILNTKDFEGRAALFAKTDYAFDPSFSNFTTKLGDLVKEDKEQIRDEIMRDGSAVPKQLKEMVGTLEI